MPVPNGMVRQQLLFQHEVLRVLLRGLGEAAERISRDRKDAQDLRDAGRTLQAVLEVHALQEEAVLAPLLLAAGRPDRVDQLRAAHQQAIDTLRRIRGRNLGQFAAGSRRLVRHLLAAVDAEDRELLAPELFTILKLDEAKAKSGRAPLLGLSGRRGGVA